MTNNLALLKCELYFLLPLFESFTWFNLNSCVLDGQLIAVFCSLMLQFIPRIEWEKQVCESNKCTKCFIFLYEQV